MCKATVFFIVGPTASGKTAAAVAVARATDGEIVSADAFQIYRGIEIGTAKPTVEEMQGVTHHLIDITDCTDSTFNVARFREESMSAIEKIFRSDKQPIVAGGTGLYVNSLVYPLDFTSVAPNEEIRGRLIEQEKNEPGFLYSRLCIVDPVSAKRLHPNDQKRIIRAIEVFECSGKSLTDLGGDFANERRQEIPYHPVMAGITMRREILYDRINRRVDIMLENGLVDEAKAIFDSGVDLSLPSMHAIGYRQLFAYFKGEYSYEDAVEAIKRETRRFAKRQISWFKRDERILWFDADEYASAADMHEAMIGYFTEVQNE